MRDGRKFCSPVGHALFKLCARVFGQADAFGHACPTLPQESADKTDQDETETDQARRSAGGSKIGFSVYPDTQGPVHAWQSLACLDPSPTFRVREFQRAVVPSILRLWTSPSGEGRIDNDFHSRRVVQNDLARRVGEDDDFGAAPPFRFDFVEVLADGDHGIINALDPGGDRHLAGACLRIDLECPGLAARKCDGEPVGSGLILQRQAGRGNEFAVGAQDDDPNGPGQVRGGFDLCLQGRTRVGGGVRACLKPYVLIRGEKGGQKPIAFQVSSSARTVSLSVAKSLSLASASATSRYKPQLAL